MSEYTKESFATLEWNEHIRQRPGMYIGHVGDGSSPHHAIYVLVKEVIDNSIDEFAMGNGKQIDITLVDRTISVRDYGRGIPLERVVDAASKMMSGAKFDNKTFQKSIGLNGVGLKAVNATSSDFFIESVREEVAVWAKFQAGILLEKGEREAKKEKNGTFVRFTADTEVFKNYQYNMDFVVEMVRNYSYLNRGLTLKLNDSIYASKNGLLDLVNDNLGSEALYPPIHLMGQDIEMVITHGENHGENIASFVNGQNTTQGGTHLAAFREAVAKTIKDFYKKDYDPIDIRQYIIGAISIKVEDPAFDDQPKTKLGSKDISEGVSIRSFIGDFMKEELDNFLHRNPNIAESLQKKIQESEKERKAISTIQKATRDKVKKASLCNKKLRDCRVHYNTKNPLAENTTLFITEGDSASGSITKVREPNTQAVFSLRGKPLNAYEKSKSAVLSNEEFILLKAALNIDEDFDNLRYNNIVLATDADVDGMHIRLLLMTFFLKYYPELVRRGHVHILQTPLFRVRNKVKTIYCYDEEEKQAAIKTLGKGHEITRFKGLGEISDHEFKIFIGEDMRLDPVVLSPDDNISHLLEFYMGANTPYRTDFIRANLRSDAVIESTTL